MFKVIRIFALFALLLTPLGVSAQTLGNNAYFPQFPNLLPAPIKLPRVDVEIPYIEVIRTDEKTGLTRYYDPAELTPADLKYTRIPRYNPQTLFPNIELDLLRNRAGGPVPVVNYSRQLVLTSNCVNFPEDQRIAAVSPDMSAFGGLPILRTAYHQFYYPSAERRNADDELFDKRYADGCWMQRAIDSAVLFFRFSDALYPGGDYAQVLRQYNRYRASLYKKLNNVYYYAEDWVPDRDSYYYRRPFFFSKSADDPLFAVVAAYPGMDELLYSPKSAFITVPFFLLTRDPSNLCALIPDQRGAPFALCGFDLNAPPVVFVWLQYAGVGSAFPSPVDPFPPFSTLSAPNGMSGANEQFPLLWGQEFWSADLYQMLLRSYPHYFLARVRSDGAKFIREHTGERYIQTYEGALLAAQRIATRQAGAPLPEMPDAEMYRVTGPSSRMITPYTSGVLQTFSWTEHEDARIKGTYTLETRRWFGPDYAVVEAKANKFGIYYSTFNDEQYYLFDYRNNAVFELPKQDNYACKFIAQSTINPQLSRPDVIANFTSGQKPRTLVHTNLLDKDATMTISDNAQGQKATYRSPKFEVIEERELKANRTGVSPQSARHRRVVEGALRWSGQYEARVSAPTGFPFDVAKKVDECRQALPRGGVNSVLQTLMARMDKVLGYEMVAYRNNFARVYFAGTPKEWAEAMRDTLRVSESLDATLTLPNGARIKFFGHQPKTLFDAQGNRVDGIVVTIRIE